ALQPRKPVRPSLTIGCEGERRKAAEGGRQRNASARRDHRFRQRGFYSTQKPQNRQNPQNRTLFSAGSACSASSALIVVAVTRADHYLTSADRGARVTSQRSVADAGGV